ncbi:MAG: TIGR01212 family radical SAM protein [Desulfohalobiaceae bacterium]|nr:TIGR01212 family radical SAM protein [Desulfohalobiaceae bacterium]
MQENVEDLIVTRLYRDFNSYLRELFGCRVQKITLDAGLTCPNRDGSLGRGGCIYCNPRGSGTGANAERKSLAGQLESAKFRLKKRYKAKKFLAYFQSYSNTYAPLPVLQALYTEALTVPDVVGLCIGTRPDCVSNEVLDYLQELSADNLIWLEYGLQSAKDRTLERINRQHTADQFAAAVARTRERGLPVCAHVILGLPGETRQDMLDTARFLARMQVEAVKIHLLYVVRGTSLHGLYQRGSYRCLEQEEYCALAGDFLSLLPAEVIIQRLTGDPHPEELVAPAWALEKQNNLRGIQDYMLQNNLVQGARHADPT